MFFPHIGGLWYIIDKVQQKSGQRDGLSSWFFKWNVKGWVFLGRGLMAALGTTRTWFAGAMSSTRGGWKDVCVYVDYIYYILLGME